MVSSFTVDQSGSASPGGDLAADGMAAPGEVRARPLRILVVDDDAMILGVIARVLNSASYEVVPLASATDALAQIDGGADFDVVLSDIMMPTMTGMEFYQHLQSTRPQLLARLVFLSGGVTSALVGEFLDSIPNRVLGKPFTIKELRSTIDDVASGVPCG